jgi:hypothetical protein
VDIGAAELGAFDLEVAEVGVDDLHIAGVEWWTRICSMLVYFFVKIGFWGNRPEGGSRREAAQTLAPWRPPQAADAEK